MLKKCRLMLVAMLALLATGQADAAPNRDPQKEQSKPAAKVPTSAGAIQRSANADLESVLKQMDQASANFQSAEADFIWEQYQKVVNETDTQKGKVYYRRRGKETQMAADIQQPAAEKKYLLFADNKIRLYQPKIDQVTEHDAGKNREQVESFLVLGFGGRGHDMLKSFELKFEGYENIDNVRTAKLDLNPKSERVKNMFSHIVLWVDPARSISLKQQAFEPAGDYRLAHYGNIKWNEKIPDEVFKLKTSSKTKIVRPQGI